MKVNMHFIYDHPRLDITSSRFCISVFDDEHILYCYGPWSIFTSSMFIGPENNIVRFFGDRTPNRHDTYYKYWEHHLLSLSDADSFCHPRMVHLDEANVAHDVVFNAAYSLRNNEKKSPYAAMRATRLRNVLKESWRFYNAPLPS